eukprot:jgi/Picsp_1/4388/NSC_01894-R1_trna dimethylallyltransferase 9
MNLRKFSTQLDFVCSRLGALQCRYRVSRCCWRTAFSCSHYHHRGIMTRRGREEGGSSMAMRGDGQRKDQQERDEGSVNGALPKVLVLTGATAVGKTQLSLQLAKDLDAEIISADSVQVYKGLNIGSDKIMEHARQGIPHHLIDIMDPKDDFSAGDFYYAARDAIEDIVKRGKTPIVVGGTGFYLKWLVCGKPSTPIATKESEENVRLALDQAFEQAAKEKEQEKDVGLLSMEEKWTAGVELVRSLGDKESADRLEHQETNNWYRMTRVLDILLQRPGKTLAELDADAAIPPDYDFTCIFLHRPRITLYRRIDERVEHMLCQGLLTETAEKLTSKGLEPDTNCATRAIGYRQAMKYLQQIQSLENPSEGVADTNIIQLAKDIQNASRQLCHRQMNWFRKDSKFKWITADQDEEQLVKEIMNMYYKGEQTTNEWSEAGQAYQG